MGLRQPLIFDLDSSTDGSPTLEERAAPSAAAEEAEVGKYRKSGLRQEEVERLWQKLSGVMQEEKPYVEAGLKLGDLARKVGSRPDYLSQVINTKARMNFYEFVNKFRVEEACRMLERDPRGRHTIADIAQDAGFSSINIFNRHFKRLQNTTPSAYRKKFAARATEPRP
jgi:AraC-like DNA-binding protein